MVKIAIDIVLVVYTKSTTSIDSGNNVRRKRANGVTWRSFVTGVNLLYELVPFWMRGLVALS